MDEDDYDDLDDEFERGEEDDFRAQEGTEKRMGIGTRDWWLGNTRDALVTAAFRHANPGAGLVAHVRHAAHHQTLR